MPDEHWTRFYTMLDSLRFPGESNRSLAKRLGVSPKAITDWSRGAVPWPENVRKMCEKANLSKDIAMALIGASAGYEQDQLGGGYHPPGPTDERVPITPSPTKGDSAPVATFTEGPTRTIPLFEYTVAASLNGRIVYDDAYENLTIPESSLEVIAGGISEDLIAIRFAPAAWSMYPDFRPGDVVVIDKQRGRRACDFQSGGAFCVVLEDGSHAVKRVFKESDQLVLSSDNLDKKEYPDFNAWTSDLQKLIIGQVILVLPRQPEVKKRRK